MKKLPVIQPNYDECETAGEATTYHSENHLCNRCLMRLTCFVAKAADEGTEFLPMVSKCLAFINVPNND
jgi:hypothetical protein